MTLRALEVAGYFIVLMLCTVGAFCLGEWAYDRFLVDCSSPDDAGASAGTVIPFHQGEQGLRVGCETSARRCSTRKPVL